MGENKRDYLTETVSLYFPNIDKVFYYNYRHRMNMNRVEQAMRTFYETEAPTLFALYGYAPMDVEVLLNGIDVASYHACYQETLWHSFFREGGESWHGLFGQFELSLIEFRHRNDEMEKRERETKKAA